MNQFIVDKEVIQELKAIRNKWWNLVLSKIYISEYHV